MLLGIPEGEGRQVETASKLGAPEWADPLKLPRLRRGWCGSTSPVDAKLSLGIPQSLGCEIMAVLETEP